MVRTTTPALTVPVMSTSVNLTPSGVSGSPENNIMVSQKKNRHLLSDHLVVRKLDSGEREKTIETHEKRGTEERRTVLHWGGVYINEDLHGGEKDRRPKRRE